MHAGQQYALSFRKSAPLYADDGNDYEEEIYDDDDECREIVEDFGMWVDAREISVGGKEVSPARLQRHAAAEATAAEILTAVVAEEEAPEVESDACVCSVER